MRLHQFSIGLLTELAPHEHPHLLGLNQNAGAVSRQNFICIIKEAVVHHMVSYLN